MWDSPSYLGSWISSRQKQTEAAMSRAVDIYTVESNVAKDLRVAEIRAEADRAIASEKVEAEATQRQKDRESRERIALLETLAKTIPALAPVGGAVMLSQLKDKDKSNKNDNNTNSSRGATQSDTVTGVEPVVSEAQKKADDLFPEVPRTFKEKVTSVLNGVSGTGPMSKPLTMGLGAAAYGLTKLALSVI